MNNNSSVFRLQQLLQQARLFRFNLRKYIKISDKYKATPSVCAMVVLTTSSVAVTFCSWILLKLLPNQQIISSLKGKTPIELLQWLPEAVKQWAPEAVKMADASFTPTPEMTGSLLSQGPYILMFALFCILAFCFITLILAFLKNM